MTNYTYAMPNATDGNGIYTLVGYVNNVSDGIFMPVMLGVLWFITFITITYNSTPSKALTFASFICAVLGMMLAVLGFLAPKYMYLLFLLTGLGVFWMILESRANG